MAIVIIIYNGHGSHQVINAKLNNIKDLIKKIIRSYQVLSPLWSSGLRR